MSVSILLLSLHAHMCTQTQSLTKHYVSTPYAKWQDWVSQSSRCVLPPFDFYQLGYESSSFEWRWFPNTFRILEKWQGRKPRGFLLCCPRICLSPYGAVAWGIVVIIHMLGSVVSALFPHYILFPSPEQFLELNHLSSGFQHRLQLTLCREGECIQAWILFHICDDILDSQFVLYLE